MKYNRLSSISVSDNKLFKYNSDVMNECFAGNYPHYFNDATKDVYGGYVWFPKERVKDKYGDWQPGSNEVNWKNYLSDDGERIYMYLNPGETAKKSVKERPLKPKEAVPAYVFMKSDKYDGCYKYIGTFLSDINASTGDKRIFRLLNDEIDLSIWFNSINSGYYEVEGHPAYKELYLGGDFKNHMNLISRFDFESAQGKYNEKIAGFLERYSIPKITRLGEASFKADFIKGLISVIEAVYGTKLAFKDLYPSGVSFPDIGMEYYKLLSDSENYNETIKTSILGMKFSGMVKGIFDSYYYVYGMDDSDIDECLFKVGFSDRISESRIEKCCLLYFWKQCMIDTGMDKWSIPAYIEFINGL